MTQNYSSGHKTVSCRKTENNFSAILLGHQKKLKNSCVFFFDSLSRLHSEKNYSMFHMVVEDGTLRRLVTRARSVQAEARGGCARREQCEV